MRDYCHAISLGVGWLGLSTPGATPPAKGVHATLRASYHTLPLASVTGDCGFDQGNIDGPY